jgi:hypothetical protein
MEAQQSRSGFFDGAVWNSLELLHGGHRESARVCAMWRECRREDSRQVFRFARGLVISRFRYAMLLIVMTTSSQRTGTAPPNGCGARSAAGSPEQCRIKFVSAANKSGGCCAFARDPVTDHFAIRLGALDNPVREETRGRQVPN